MNRSERKLHHFNKLQEKLRKLNNEYISIFSFASQNLLSNGDCDLNLKQLTSFDSFDWKNDAKSILDQIEEISVNLKNKSNENFCLLKDPKSFESLLIMLQKNEVSSFDDFKVLAAQIIFQMSLTCSPSLFETYDRDEIKFMFQCLLL